MLESLGIERRGLGAKLENTKYDQISMYAFSLVQTHHRATFENDKIYSSESSSILK